jgi:putative inorganic carbon (hco3(-)) transporter
MEKTTMKLLNICSRIIEYSFYALFLLTPLAFRSDTSELFELNKMWLVWGLTILIGMSWFIKMVLQKRFLFQRTPLDVPIGLFLLSQVISTIFSLDSHTSFWGYYSRFNGGLLSIFSYIFLFYAFLSNFDSQKLSAICHRLLAISLVSGLIVALWGLPSHFGYDPTCLIFRGTLDVSCWTADFLPKVRIFSTLGQPDWLAAYLAILIPIAIAYGMKEIRDKRQEKRGNWLLIVYRLSLIALFYVDLLYTRARSGFVGVWISLIFFFLTYIWIEKKSFKSLVTNSQTAIVIGTLLILTFIMGTPINQINHFTLPGISSFLQKIQAPKTSNQIIKSDKPASNTGGGTESADIRLLVWEGAINAWKDHPIFGTGVETFAFDYYKYKPAGQNLTSEWSHLYNKAHNEYLNYLATTGLFGLGTYLLMIGSFIFVGMRMSNSKHEAPNPKQSQNSNLFRVSKFEIRILTLALIAAYVSILVTNFFGFSVVMTNIYLFMIPAFVFVLSGMIKPKTSVQSANSSVKIESSIWQWTPIFFILVASCLLLIALFRFWLADIAFALGYNLDRALEYQRAYPYLHKAVLLRGNEPVFKDELSINDAIIATELVSQKPKDEKTGEQSISVASSLAQEAINVSNEIVSQYPNNAVFWKTRTKLFLTLSQVDSRYLSRALDAIKKASLLAPNDANIWYFLGVLYGQNNNLTEGISALEKTIKLKPDYRDAHYGLGFLYHTASLDKDKKIVADQALNQKAIDQMQYILTKINLKDADALKSIADWTK